MIRWVRRGAALGSGIFLVGWLLPRGNSWTAVSGGLLSLALAVAEHFPSSVSRWIPPLFLLGNSLLAGLAVMAGASPAAGVVFAVLTLSAWNIALFAQRWMEAPPAVEIRYLIQLGTLAALGLGGGLSALIWQGKFSLPFFLALLLMLTAGVFWLFLISPGSKE